MRLLLINIMKIDRKWNKLWIGLALGVLLPVIAFLLIYFIGYGAKYPLWDFVRQSYNVLVLTKMLSLCIIPNLGAFYFFLNREFWYATRGIILATLLCTLALVIINFL